MEETSQSRPGRPAPAASSRPTYRVLQWLLVLAVLYTLYFARTLIVPVVIALMLTLLMGPLVSLLKRFMVPRSVSAVLLLGLILGPILLLLSELRDPVERWVERTPDLSERLNEQIQALQSAWGGGEASDEASEGAEGFFANLFGGEELQQEEAEQSAEDSPIMEGLTRGGIELGLYVFAAAPVLLAQLITCLTLTIFFLVFGPRLFEAAITHLPQITDKEGARALVGTVQIELSRFILSLSVINALLGLAVAGALTLLGVEDALLWGVLVGVLNFAPYIGTLIGMVVLTLAGLAQFGATPEAMLPVLVYFVINGLEAQFITPTVMGQRMRLNPLVLMVWLIFWAWLWGMVGVLLAVPLLVCIKLTASQLHVPNHWVRVLETHA